MKQYGKLWDIVAATYPRTRPFSTPVESAETTALHLPRYFQFLGGAAFGFEFLGVRLPAQLHSPARAQDESPRIVWPIFPKRAANELIDSP